jgi:DtxR family transcriptional regulator, Mn-dependent transcriptional regulator
MSASTEEYLEALYTLSQQESPVSTSAISRKLNIAAASVSEMLKKLDEGGYVSYLPYQGVTLTTKGHEEAEKMARKHRLLERFLHDTLKIGNDRVHKEACAMEHALSAETERALCRTLKAPDKCPDDAQPIPPCNLNFSTCAECQQSTDDPDKIGKREKNVVSLSTLKKDQEGKIAFIRGDTKVLHRLMDLGLTPGTRVKVSRIAPLNGPVEIAVRGCKLALGDEIVSNVFLEGSRGEA